MNLAENIYRCRSEKNMSQLDLAEALDVSRQSVSKWETCAAVPELEKLIKMSDLFGISLDELVGRAPAVPAIPEAQPAPVQPGITTGDMVSILLLLFGVLIPIVIVATSESHNSFFLFAVGLFVIPPAATICAACCSPKNTVLFRVYLVYVIITGIPAAIAASVFAPLVIIFYVFAIGYWNDKREGQ